MDDADGVKVGVGCGSGQVSRSGCRQGNTIYISLFLLILKGGGGGRGQNVIQVLTAYNAHLGFLDLGSSNSFLMCTGSTPSSSSKSDQRAYGTEIRLRRQCRKQQVKWRFIHPLQTHALYTIPQYHNILSFFH